MTGFNTAITGLKAATTDLDVTGNNIANSSTVGFKASRTEFGDIYATAVVGAGSSNIAGSGVTVTDIAQDFQAGTIEFTNNNLDLAINGSGFFELDDGQGGTTYTRSGAFELDKDGFIVSKTGKFLQGFGLDAEGNRLPIGNLAVTQKESPPKATEVMRFAMNLDDRDDASLLSQPYDRDDSGSFTTTTTVPVFDSLGNENSIKYNFAEQPPIYEVQTLSFASTGGLQQDNDPLTQDSVVISNAVLDQNTLRAGVGLNPDGTLVAGEYRLPGQVQALELSGLTNPGEIGSIDLQLGSVNFLAANIDPDPAINPELDFLDDFSAVANEDEFAGVIAGNAADIINYYNANKTATEPHMIGVRVDPLNPSNVYFQFDNSNSAPAAANFGITLNDGTAGAPVPGITTAVSTYDFGAEATSLLNSDSRIRSIEIAEDGESIDVRFKASATDVDDVQVRDESGNVLASVSITSEQVPANEVHTYSFNPAAFDAGTLEAASPTITIGGVSITLSTADTPDDIEAKIVAAQAAIIEANPDVESVQFNAQGQMVITYNPLVGNIDNNILDVSFADGLGNDIMQVDDVVSGDNSFNGVYRMYAYLNNNETLDIGKAVDPGEPGYVAPTAQGDSSTEPGPIIVTFDPTSGFLQSVNGRNVPLGGSAPTIEISGADPADANTIIELDITGTTQFSGESIQKSAFQDGYEKGDLIGVTFGGSGEMIASFSNGQTQNLGVVALATFENQSGLQPAGDTEWGATLSSGNAILNPPGTGLNGSLQSAALEQSNVDLSEELVALIEAQRNFQANSKTLETLNTVTQNILQI